MPEEKEQNQEENSVNIELEPSVDQVTAQSTVQPNMSGRSKILKQAAPLIALFALNLFYQHAIQVILFISLILAFDYWNNIIVNHYRLQQLLKPLLLLVIFSGVVIALLIPLVNKFWIFNVMSLHNWWYFQPPNSFWSVLFDVAVMDFTIKFFTVTLKGCLMLFKNVLSPNQHYSGVLVLIEALSQLFRCISPAPEWIKYFMTSPSCMAYVVCWTFVGLYAVMKLYAIKSQFLLLKRGWTASRNSYTIGTPVSDDNFLKLPNKSCPICHGGFKEPVQVLCGHAFCKRCCQIWFDRDSRCPVCSSNTIYKMVMEPDAPSFSPPEISSKNLVWKTGASEYVIYFF